MPQPHPPPHRPLQTGVCGMPWCTIVQSCGGGNEVHALDMLLMLVRRCGVRCAQRARARPPLRARGHPLLGRVEDGVPGWRPPQSGGEALHGCGPAPPHPPTTDPTNHHVCISVDIPKTCHRGGYGRGPCDQGGGHSQGHCSDRRCCSCSSCQLWVQGSHLPWRLWGSAVRRLHRHLPLPQLEGHAVRCKRTRHMRKRT